MMQESAPPPLKDRNQDDLECGQAVLEFLWVLELRVLMVLLG
jgi:hypothetical protein